MAKESLCRKATELNFDKFLEGCKKCCELKSVSLSNTTRTVYNYNCLTRFRYLIASSYQDEHDFYNGDLEYILGLEYKNYDCYDIDHVIMVDFIQDSIYLMRDGFFRDFNIDLLILLRTYDSTAEIIGALNAKDLLKGLGPYYPTTLRENFYAKKFNFFYEHCSDDKIHSFILEHGLNDRDLAEKIYYCDDYDDIEGAEKLHREIHDFIFYYTDSANNTNG